jgi:hypothetical protein
MAVKRPNRAVVLMSAVFLAIGGIGWLIQGLRKWDFFETMTGGYTLAGAVLVAFGWRDERRSIARATPEQPVNDEGPLSR